MWVVSGGREKRVPKESGTKAPRPPLGVANQKRDLVPPASGPKMRPEATRPQDPCSRPWSGYDGVIRFESSFEVRDDTHIALVVFCYQRSDLAIRLSDEARNKDTYVMRAIPKSNLIKSDMN